MSAVLIGLLEALGLWLSPRLDRFFPWLLDRPLRWVNQRRGVLPPWLRMAILSIVSLAVLAALIPLLVIGFIWLFGALLRLVLLVLGVPQD
mgnify:CR=1 FL=1